MSFLYIKSKLVDLPKNLKIARTKQVNSIGRLDNRQTNYTQRIKLPKTKNNKEIFENLGAIGNKSSVPYNIVGAELFNDNGESEIKDGIVMFKETNLFYDIVIYDGYISFAKAIENKDLSDAGLSELNHLINLQTVQDSWVQDLPYLYIVADYNGNALVNNRVNIDYLIPSVNVKYLWDKVHEFAGFEYEGSVFETDNFKDLWITYPKTIGDGTQQTIPVEGYTWDKQIVWFNPDNPNDLVLRRTNALTASTSIPNPTPTDNQYITGNSFPISLLGVAGSVDDTGFDVNTTGLYKVTIKGLISCLGSQQSGGSINLIRGIDSGTGLPVYEPFGDYNFGESFEFIEYFNLTQGEFFTITARVGQFLGLNGCTGDVDTDIEFVTGNTVDFQEAFIDLGMKEFVDEILVRHSLTPFKDPYEDKIIYLTHQEWLQTDQIVDWSADKGKFSRKISESYTFGNYAQRNYLRYKYNDENADHNDSYINVANKNLKDSQTIFKSVLFSPEKEQSKTIGGNVYKFWDKEIKDDSTVEYKPLDNRFYIMRAERTIAPINLTSEIAMQDVDVTSGYPFEDFARLQFLAIVQDFYNPIYQILNSARKVKAEIYLNDIDARHDFKKLIFIKEEASYFILDKLPNYIEKGKYKVDLIEVDFFSEGDVSDNPLTPRISLISSASAPNPFIILDTYKIANTYAFLDYVPVDGVTIQALQYTDLPSSGGTLTGEVLNGVIDEGLNNFTFNLGFLPAANLLTGWWEVIITDPNQGVVSLPQYVTFQDFTVGQPSITMNPEVNGNPTFNIAHLRGVIYTFNNFQPLNATLKLQQYNFIAQAGVGAVSEFTLTGLTQDTQFNQEVLFPPAFGFYLMTIETDTISLTAVRLAQ